MRPPFERASRRFAKPAARLLVGLEHLDEVGWATLLVPLEPAYRVAVHVDDHRKWKSMDIVTLEHLGVLGPDRLGLCGMAKVVELQEHEFVMRVFGELRLRVDFGVHFLAP